MKGIFISYRRQDAAGYAGRLYDRLASHFGAERVFMDVEGIEPGLDFVDALESAVASCEALIVIIGPEWLAPDKAGRRRLDDPKDFVRIETAAALARNIRVVPVLVDGAVMPRTEELPADLAPLARRQAVELSHKYWDATSAELIRTLERVLDGDKAAGGRKAPAAPMPPPEPEEAPLLVVRTRDIRRFWVIGAMLALVAVAIGLYVMQPWQEEPVPAAEHAAVAPPAKTIEAPPSEKAASTVEKPAAPPAEKTAPTAEKPAAPPAEKTAPTAEKPAAPPAEKTAPLASEKPTAPPSEKTAPRPTEKPATPSVAKTQPPAPARAPEKTAASEPSQASRPSSAQAPARSGATTAATPPARGPETVPAPAPPDATATPTRPADKPSVPVATAPATTPPAAPPAAPAVALPATLPRVGDTWEYRMRSKWATVQPRTYAHRVTAVSAREVAETMSVGASAEGAAVRHAITPETRFVEWRGLGFYFLEFNPFLEAFGGLQNATATLEVPAMPAENPFHAGWYSRGRVRGYESVTVPAGTFKALKVEIDSTRRSTESAGGRSHEPIRVLLTLWYAPEVKRTVKMLRIVLTPEGMHLDEDTCELVRYRVQ